MSEIMGELSVLNFLSIIEVINTDQYLIFSSTEAVTSTDRNKVK